jgi:hypothetical protein
MSGEAFGAISVEAAAALEERKRECLFGKAGRALCKDVLPVLTLWCK